MKPREREKEKGTQGREKRMIIAIRAYDLHRSDGKV